MKLKEKNSDVLEIENKINYKILLLILGLTVITAILFAIVEDDTYNLDFTDITYGIGALTCGIICFWLFKKYRGSEIFGKTYLALGFAFTSFFVGDIIWNYYTIILLEDPYPSLADIFYITFYPLAMYHLVSNIRYFGKKINPQTILLLVALSFIIVGWYSFLAIQEVDVVEFDTILAIFYSVLSAVTLSLAILGVIVFYKSVLAPVWVLFASGMFILMISDTWYYYVELVSGYTGNHPVNVLWTLAFMVIAYALIKHTKIL